MTSRSRVLAAALSATFLLTACNAGSTSDDPTDGENNATGDADNGDSTGGTGGTAAPGDDAVRIGLVAEPASLDFTTTDGAAIPQVLLYNVYESLVKVDQSGEIVPALASAWEVSEDGKTYTFTLEQGVTFSNGETFTAEDVVSSFEAVQNDWTVSLKSQFDIIESIEATSDTEVVITLASPSNSFLYSLTTRVGAIFDSNSVDELATRPIGTGPYTFGEWNRGSSITLQRNSDYWGEEPYFDQVELAYFSDANALNNAMLTDSIDVVGTVQAPEALSEFEGGDYQIIEGTTNGEVVLSFNNETEPFNDLRVRQAARHAINHQALLDTCWDGRGTLIGSMVPPTDPWYEDRTGDYPYDVEAAKALLAEAGAEGAEVRLRIPTLPYATACAPIVESMLEEAGFAVTIDDLEFPAAWIEDVFTNADYEMSIVSHVEPRDLKAVLGNPDYYIRYGTPELRTLLDEADAGTEEVQIEKMKEAAKLVSEDAASDFLFLLPNLIVADPGITGLPENAITESFDLSQLAGE
ncbi:ABC transporter substrate-binding protein [Ornithinimicrobium faecis]|uniref:ABC transporter substrate-binding protein n=1 Tax=Ornithinimicrobium faecis TaxID=2934158 RepID=A0ABY4YUE1_9MICO|nr:ABC transporter substrate-binding protein [Ornithinimicrobium sp. HY1793]USQ80377.1 ABC transporter substrate-binding protein [Ornithinimicrobium sp. HY1793]